MEFKLIDLGLVDFKEAWQLQKDLFAKVKAGSLNSGLITCRHNPVITLGRSAKKEHIRAPESELKNRGVKTYAIERGGDVTYHGPGQLVVYPIFNLNHFKKDIHLFLRILEEVAIRLLGDFGILGQRRRGLTGVWVGDNKISSIGIAIRNWITYHGLAINVKKSDLFNFSLIRPCGMDITMTSMESVLNQEVSVDDVKNTLIRRLQNDQSNFTGIRRGN